ncbi:nicotinamide riboside transporter PnuC [Piscinibacter koreensis]|uniref:Nicotinamide riboside transporter PnuC n=1 Tax=Piscinibacter koreensis TaxID=2742824 RepID=A0A7Y6NJI2_9BURK|nr:nicotinamide riboside transporter PnuC [Schlegelella koreensis]NUZ04254.1 nicotinamide mononucleotide transporter [Schlegelella koreensis]
MNGIEVAANMAALASILLAGRNNVNTWWTGMLACTLFGFVFHASRLYAGMALQVFLVVTSALGWWSWLGGAKRAPLAVAHVAPVRVAAIFGAAAAGAALYGHGLALRTDAAAPYVDAVILAFSVTAQLLMMRRKVEAWPFWLLVNSVAVPLYASRGLWLTAALFGVFWVNALVSWRHWHRLARGPVAPGATRPGW